MKKYVLALLALAAGSSHALEAFHAQEIQPYHAQEIQPPQPAQHVAPQRQLQPSRPSPAPSDASIAKLLGVWQTNIPGAVYTTPSGQAGYDLLHVSSGAAAGLLRLDADHRYHWNSYGGKSGRWEASGAADYPITLIDTVEHTRWKVGLDPRSGELVVWSGSYWYKGRRAAVR